MYKLVLTLALLSLACGCTMQPACGARVDDGDTVDGQLCVDRVWSAPIISMGFTPTQQQAIMDAGLDWERATGGLVHLTWGVGEPGTIRPINGAEGEVGRTYNDSGVIFVSADLPLDLQQTNAAHELGHYFGLGHTHAGEVMSPVMTTALQLSPGDVAHFMRLYGGRQ